MLHVISFIAVLIDFTMDIITELGDRKITWSPEVQKEISSENNKINIMSKLELKESVKKYKLYPKGAPKVLNRRLKSYIKKQKLLSLGLTEQKPADHKYVVIIDFEATCNKENTIKRQEIIEFPAILFDTEERRIVNEFHSYVKPVLNEKLTEFCHDLTGIMQEDIDRAPIFCDVLIKFEEWLHGNDLNSNDPNFTIVTDGPHDLSSYLLGQCELSGVKLPKWGTKWVNIKKVFSNFYQYGYLSITDMLSRLDMQLQGRLHQGIDDARNITRLVHTLLEDGAQLYTNECLIEDPTSLGGLMLATITVKDDKLVIEKKVFSQPKEKLSQKENIQQKETSIQDNKNIPVENMYNYRYKKSNRKDNNLWSKKTNEKKKFKQESFSLDDHNFPILK